MPLYEYECDCGSFEKWHSMIGVYNVICPVCKKLARRKFSTFSLRLAEPITFLQELPGGKGYQVLDWRADSGISPKQGQPYKTGKEVTREEYGGIKEV